MKALTTTNLFQSDVVLKGIHFSERLWLKDIILQTFHLAKNKEAVCCLVMFPRFKPDILNSMK